MPAYHLTSKLMEGGVLLTEPNFRVQNLIYQTLGYKIQTTPNFRDVLYNLPFFFKERYYFVCLNKLKIQLIFNHLFIVF